MTTDLAVRTDRSFIPTKFFNFRQNNSGGVFLTEEDRGISINVCIEATDADDANRRAENIGLYFDGYGDCSTCGNRWYQVSDYDAEDIPSEYGRPLIGQPSSTWGGYAKRYGFIVESFIHYMDGRVIGLDEDGNIVLVNGVSIGVEVEEDGA